eukprot:g2625.t1
MSTAEPKAPATAQHWYIGVLLYTTGATFLSLSLNVMKKILDDGSRAAREKNPGRSRSNSVTDASHLWSTYTSLPYLGMFLVYIAAGVCLSSALAFARQAQLAPLLSLTLASNLVFAHYINGEPITHRDFFAVALIVTGTSVTTIFSPRSNEEISNTQLVNLLQSVTFVIFIFLMGSAVLVSWLVKTYSRAKIDNVPKKDQKVWILRYSAASGALSGCLAGLSVSFMKTALSVTMDIAKETGFASIFINKFFWLVLIPLFICWLLAAVMLNEALHLSSAKIVVTIDAITAEISALIGGMLYFQEFAAYSTLQIIMFSIGFVVGAAGLFFFISENERTLISSGTSFSEDKPGRPKVNEDGLAEETRSLLGSEKNKKT